jgi:uncharacterized membrane protein YdbT with pleckstrin-like domain
MVAMEKDNDLIWSGRPWIGPSLALRTIGAIVVGFLAIVALLDLDVGFSLLGFPLYVWVLLIIAVAWLASITGLLVLRASSKYVLRRSSMEVDRGIVSRRSLVISPSAFSELEVDQGVVGRMLNYGSLEVRSQGGQQLNLRLIHDPNGVSSKIRDAMTIPTVRLAKDEPAAASQAPPP